MDYILIASVAGNVVLATYCWSLYKRLAYATRLAKWYREDCAGEE